MFNPENTFLKKENKQEKLETIMLEIAKKTNEELGIDLLNPNNSINMDSFKDSYSEEEINKNKQEIINREIEWSGACNEATLNFYKEKYKLNTTEEDLKNEVVQIWKDNKNKSKPTMMELATTGLFYRILKEKYIVTRSSTYDDYKNGVDNILVNKETGEVICAFDEVRGETKHGEKERKEDKIIKTAKNGGTEIKYGFTFKEKEITKETIKNIPIFYLSMEDEELEKLITNLGKINDPINETEKNIYTKLITSLSEQINLLENKDIPKTVKDNILRFKELLKDMEIKKAD